MTKTVIFHNVPEAAVNQLETDLKRDGYNTAKYVEPDKEYTVIGTKDI